MANRKWILIATGYGPKPSAERWYDRLRRKRTGVQTVGVARFQGADVIQTGVLVKGPSRRR